MLSTPDRKQLDRACAIIRQVLNSNVVGAYLFGSAVQGGLRPGSDLDILVLCKQPTTLSEKKRLIHNLMDISGKDSNEGLWRRVEVTIVIQADITPWRYPPSLDLQYGDWLRSEFEKGNFEPSPTPLNPDLALLITMVIAADTALIGPSPACVFEPVPHEHVLRAMVGDLGRLRGEIDSDTRNVILTFARMWSTFATGVICSKDEAANWAVERLPSAYKSVVAHARDAYLGSEAEQWDDLSGSIVPCVDYMINEIERLATASSLQG
jgi:streptomycin 3"-adenylyltransferase